jgi:D-amino peptidase
MPFFKRVLIVADIEGSSGCWRYEASAFKTTAWVGACIAMTRDVQAVVKKLYAGGVRQVIVKDFHRTGYNLIPEWIDPRARVIGGYKDGPVPGIGDPGTSEAVLYLGLHAASGSQGFLAHTLTSRIQHLEVNGNLLPEVALFSASLAPFGVRPIFFSGCPVACEQAQRAIPGIQVYPIDKSAGRERFAEKRWREGLAAAAAASLENSRTDVYAPEGPFRAVLTMRDGTRAAKKLAQRWGFDHRGAQILLSRNRYKALYRDLIRICYLTPMAERLLPLALAATNLRGRAGLAWLRRQVKRANGS